MLAHLLEAKLPKFWLPVNNNGQDVLRLAAVVKSRMCIKLLLDKINAAKHEGQLARVPTDNDRFLRDLLRLTRDFHDLARETPTEKKKKEEEGGEEGERKKERKTERRRGRKKEEGRRRRRKQ